MLLALVAVCSGAWLLVAVTHRVFVCRISVAIIFACVLGAALRRLRDATVDTATSKFELDLSRPAAAPQFDPLLLRLREELTRSIRSQSYFLHILWPRLAELSRQHSGFMHAAPRAGFLLWRGQSLDEIEQCIAEIEARTPEQP
ncbi:hypothetical protein [Paraburkholderia fungorum]